LVVIAIISLLAAILFPVFGRAREDARRSSCQSNLKQIGVAVMQYTQDYDEEVVPAVFYTSTSSFRSNWVCQTYPYVRNTQIYQCPSDSSTDSPPINYWSIFSPPPHTSYIYNWHVTLNVGGNDVGGVFLSAFANPSQTVLACDGGTAPISALPATSWTVKDSPWMLGMATLQYVPLTASTDVNNLLYAAPNPRHFDTSDVLFADGHVKALQPAAFYNNLNVVGKEANGTSAAGWSPCLDPASGCI